MSLMGIDIGTSGCKSAVYSLSGECLASARRTYSPIMPKPGRMEFDCNNILSAVLDTIYEANQLVNHNSSGKNDPVSALSVGSFSEAVVPLSRSGEILGNSIAGSDNRHSSAMKPLEDMGRLDFYKINPNILSFTYTYPKLAWYRDEAPELYERVWKFLNWSDYLVFYLTGCAASTYSHANRTLLFDVAGEVWSDELLDRVDLKKSHLGDPLAAGEVIGNIKPEVSRSIGFRGPVSVVSGGHDQCLNALGAGAVKGGQSVTGIGTFECTTLIFDSLPEAELLLSLNLSIEHHVVPGKFVTLIYNQAGSLQTWFLNVFAKELLDQGMGESEILNLLASESPPEPSGIVFLPTIEPTGAPYFLAGQSGTFHGINANSGRGDMYKAMLEGESMYFLDIIGNLENHGFPIDEFIASGGGSLSNLWLQIKADLFGKTVRKAGFIDSGTVGAAVLAGASTGRYSSLTEAADAFNREQPCYKPSKERGELYQPQIEKFKRLFNLYG